jgi:hypothetical protein
MYVLDHRTMLTAILTLLFPWSVVAAEARFEVTVEAGAHDRTHAVAKSVFLVPSELGSVKTAQLLRDGQPAIIAQLTAPDLLDERVGLAQGTARRQVNFVVPSLKKGETVKYELMIKSDAPAATMFAWHDTPGQYADLSYGDRPVLRYMYQALDDSTKESRELTYKPFHHVYDPSGKRIVTKGAGGQFTHHRGLYFGFNKVTYGDGKLVDTWHCKPDAYESHDKFVAEEAGPVLGRHRLVVGWHGVGKETFAEEDRELTAYQMPGGTLIEFACRLQTASGPIKLDGDPQHAGFHFRADNEVNDKTKGLTYYLRPDGKDAPGKTRNWPGDKGHVNLPWNAMSFVLGDQRYTVAYLDRPENPKEARFSERDYGRFGSYFEYTITDEKPLRLNYRVWLQTGEMTGEEVTAKSRDFVEPVAVSVENK